MLYPMLHLGYIADDLAASWQAGFLIKNGISPWAQIIAQTRWWIDHEGRFYPGSAAYGELFFAANPSMLNEKIVQLAFVLLNIFTLYFVMRRVAGPRFALATQLAFVATLQVRAWFDAIIAFFIIVPFTVEFLLLSLWFWLIAIQKRSTIWTLAASGSGIIALLTYELSYPVVVAIAACCWMAASSSRWRAISQLGTLGPLSALVVTDLILRNRVAVNVYALSLDRAAGARTFIGQFLAPLPLTYSFFKDGAHPLVSLLAARPSAYLAAILGATFGYVALESGTPMIRSARWQLIVFGLTLWIGPALIASFAHGMQATSSISNGYLNCYLESVGVSIILTVVVFFILDLIPIRWMTELFRLTIAGLFAVSIALTAATNRDSMAAYLPVWTNTRVLFDRAFAAGLVRPLINPSVASKTELYLNDTYPISTFGLPYLIFQDSGQFYTGSVSDHFDPGSACIKNTVSASLCSPPRPTWLLQVSEIGSIVALTHLAGIRHLTDGRLMPITDRWYLAHIEGSGVTIKPVASCAGFPVADVIDSSWPSNVTFGPGFTGPETLGSQTWRWGSTKHTTIRVERLLPSGNAYKVHLILRSLGTAQVTIDAPGIRLHAVTAGSKQIPVTIPLKFERSEATQIRITTNTPTLHVSGDPRELAIQVSDVRLQPICDRRGLRKAR